MATFKGKIISYWKRAEPFLRHQYLALFSRIVLGGIFIFAGQAKLFPVKVPTENGTQLFPNVQTLINFEIPQYGLLPHQLATAYGWTLPPLEILIGALLVLGIFLKTSSVIGGLVTISFIIAKVSALIRGLDIAICGCFGPAVPLLSVYSLAIDFVMLALAAQIFFRKGEFLEFGSWIKRVADRSKEKAS
jgi:uncharacterized membrane protein YphA (DoxX/SURF4 family)